MQVSEKIGHHALHGHQSLEIPRLPLASFNDKFAQVLPKLIDFLRSDELRKHHFWGSVIPYDIPSYGTGTSRGWCVRPDVVFTAKGCRVCELDFVPSGRGDMLASLGVPQQDEVLEVFAQWYRNMGVRRVMYATASTTVCRSETVLFATGINRHGIQMHAGNIDETPESDLAKCFIDRLFYRSEMSMEQTRKQLLGLDVSTAEPYLDSKLVFAMIHDAAMTETLERTLGTEALAFLREVFPNTRLLSSLDEKQRERIATEKDRWVLKATDVEVDHHWGSRGVVVGLKYTAARFREALNGKEPNNKKMGKQPILQEWCPSRDFWQCWNDVVEARYHSCRLPQIGGAPEAITSQYAKKHVGARVGFYFLVTNGSSECLVSPYGDLRLRQDELVHGARDAICLAVGAH